MFYLKDKLSNVRVLNYVPNKEIYGYIVYVRKGSKLWYFLSFFICLPICIKEQCVIYQEPIYTNDFAPF